MRTALKQVNGELEQSHWFMNEGLRVIKNDPWRYARLSFRKIFQLWLNVGFDEPPSRVSYALAATGLASFADIHLPSGDLYAHKGASLDSPTALSGPVPPPKAPRCHVLR